MGKRKRKHAEDPDDGDGTVVPRGKSSKVVEEYRKRAEARASHGQSASGNHDQSDTVSEDENNSSSKGAMADALKDISRNLKHLLSEQKRLADMVAEHSQQLAGLRSSPAETVKSPTCVVLDANMVPDMVPLAAALFWSRGGWNARWSSDKSRLFSAALDGAMAHLCGPDKTFDRLDAETRAMLNTKMSHKVDNMLRVRIHIFFYFPRSDHRCCQELRKDVASTLNGLLCTGWRRDSPKNEAIGKGWLEHLREDLDAVDGPWQLNCSFNPGSSRLDKLRGAETHKKFRAFLWNYRRFREGDDISEGQVSGEEGEYGPLFVYLWKECFRHFLSILNDISKHKRLENFERPTCLGIKVCFAHLVAFFTDSRISWQVNGESIVTPQLLALFDACVITSPWAHAITEGERRTKIQMKVGVLEDEHEEASENLLKAFAKHGL